jgi:hypothetical protein
VFLSWQAHFLHSRRRCGFILAGRSSGVEPGSESGLLRKNLVAASSTTPRVPVDCSRLRRSDVLFPGHSLRPDTRLNHFVHQTIKNENTLREDCMRRSCSFIHEALRKSRRRISCTDTARTGREECIIDYPTPPWKRLSQAALLVRRRHP